jgi:hypothetical protein
LTSTKQWAIDPIPIPISPRREPAESRTLLRKVLVYLVLALLSIYTLMSVRHTSAKCRKVERSSCELRNKC